MRYRFFLCIITFYTSIFAQSSNKPVLWYQQPAQEWTQALPVGNGRLGAMVFGKVGSERIQLNEESIWAGQKMNNNNPRALTHLDEIRQMLFNGRFEQAYAASEKYVLGTPPRIRSYQPLGNLWLEYGDSTDVSGYRRQLDLSTGMSLVTFQNAGNTIKQEVFASAPDNLIAVHLTSEQKNGLDVTVGLTREKDAVITSVSGNVLVLDGQIIDEPDSLRGPGGEHMRFAAYLIANPEGGSIMANNSELIVKDANALTLLLTAATDYNIDKLDFDRSINPERRCREILSKVREKSFEQIRSDHIADHRSLFNRVSLDLGQNKFAQLPTDERLKNVQAGNPDPDLVALYFQYGRYLLMNSSRAPGVLPANLQGIWNEHFKAPWNSDFHTNINLQMNYWPAEVCNLSETVFPLTDFLLELMEPGRVTARETYGADGWTLHHLTDPFGRTGVADGVWGISPLAGAWMTFTVYRHYQFTQDRGYLREKAYPLMKESAQFVMDFLVEGPDGYLATAPSHSPENRFIIPGTDQKSFLTYSATIDIQIIRGLLEYCIEAADILNVDQEFGEQLKNTLTKLPPIKVGRDGTIQEWIKDYEEAEPGHRHMSHLLGLYPLAQITPETPDLFEAAKKTIEKRLSSGGGHTGWSRAWIISFYARLLNAEKAHENMLALLKKSTLENLFDTHPPFQIDGNFGGTAGIAEMLLQSHNDVIHILPALPKAWASGSIRGLRARGAFEVDIRWKDHDLEQVEILSHAGQPCQVRYNDKIITLQTQKGKRCLLDQSLRKQD